MNKLFRSTSRKVRTFSWLLLATTVSFPLVFFVMPFFLLPPILFALALITSNKEFFRFKLTHVLVVGLFFLIYLWGTLPFYEIGRIFESEYLQIVSGCLGAFLMVTVVFRMLFIKTIFNIPQIMFVIITSFICSNIIFYVQSNFSLSLDEKSFAGVVVVYQFFMSISIVQIIENPIARKS